MHSPKRARRFYLMEPLERRYFLTIVPIDATAGVPFEGLIATDLRLPAHATGLDALGLLMHGQWDHSPTVLAHADGTFDLHTSMTPQRSGTDEMTIWFRNDLTGGWDILARGEQTIKPNHFNARTADLHLHHQIPGTRVRGALATFTPSSLTQPLEDYVVEVEGFGPLRSGRLVAAGDGSVEAYVDGAYLPAAGESQVTVTVTIRLAGAAAGAPAAGWARAYVSAGTYGVAIGSYEAAMTSDDEFRVHLPNTPKHAGELVFTPAAELEGWHSTFTAELIWQYRGGGVQTISSGTVIRNDDGTYAVVGRLPDQRNFDYPMVKIWETVHRPAVGGMPPQSYVIEYVGSFDLVPTRPAHGGGDADQPSDPTHGQPIVTGMRHAAGSTRESRFGTSSGGERSAPGSRPFDSIMSSLFSSGDEDSLIGDAEAAAAEPSQSA